MNNTDSNDNSQTTSESPRWHAQSADEVLEHLGTSRDGLDQARAESLLQDHGTNRIRQQGGRPWWRRLLDQFNDILIIILLIAGVMSLFLGKWVDAGAIFTVVLINAAVGFVQEGKAEKALEGIKGMLSPEATVRRDGKEVNINAEDVVPGDIVIIKSGDRIPADIRLLEAKQFRTEEAALTGESEPVDKSVDAVDESSDLADRSSMGYASTICAHGSAEGVVVATGTETEIGRISEMLQEVEQIQTPLLRQLDHFAKVLAGAILVVSALMATFGVLVHGRDLQEMFMAAVGLAVAAIPQGLPAIVTITLAIGVRAMAKRNAIIRRLPTVETLGAVSTIFTDKTGTLTRSEMTVSAIGLSDREITVSGVGFAPEGEFREGDSKPVEAKDDDALYRFLLAGVLCNEAQLTKEDETWKIEGDPTEGSLIVAARKAGLDPDDLRDRYRRLDDIPFESERKYMATLDESPEGEREIHVKGAPDTLLDMCSKEVSGDEALDREAWQKLIDEFSSRGLRVLALAQKKAANEESLNEDAVESDLALLGLVGMLDPPRDTAIESIETCQKAGIVTKMVTGDHALTARAIAEQMGLSDTEAMSGQDIEKASDEELRDKVMEVGVFARAAPEHKLRLIEAIQSHDRVSAMTGDGVNDAPALKRADVGVAMGIQGTEASKEAADMVLADDNFSTIVNAVEEGRRVYDNIRKTIIFLLPTNGAESLAILIAVLAGTTLPITPVQVLWVNMVTAVTLGLALAFEPAENGVMEREPRDPQAPILNKFLVWRILFVASLVVAAVYGIFMWLQHSQGASIEVARSAAVNMLVIGEVFYLLNTRFPLSRSLSFQGLFGSRTVLMAIGLVLLLQVAWTYAPPMQALFSSAGLSPLHWGLIWLAGIAVFLLVELEKAVTRRRRVGAGR